MRLTLILTYAFLVLFLALRRGEKPERLVGFVLVASMLADLLNHIIFLPAQFVSVDPGHLVIDSATFAVLLVVALRANRGWTLWVCSAQNIVLLGHIAKLYEVRAVYRGYWVMTQMPVFVQLAILACGTYAHIRRTRRIGQYASWRMGRPGSWFGLGETGHEPYPGMAGRARAGGAGS